jgi:hypothetical protein
LIAISDWLEDFLGLAGLIGGAATEAFGNQGTDDTRSGRAADPHVEAMACPKEVVVSGRDWI